MLEQEQYIVSDHNELQRRAGCPKSRVLGLLTEGLWDRALRLARLERTYYLERTFYYDARPTGDRNSDQSVKLTSVTHRTSLTSRDHAGVDDH
jgi:hypothetical protein